MANQNINRNPNKAALLKKRKRKRKIIIFAVEILLLLLVLIGLYIYLKISQIDRDTTLKETELGKNKLSEITLANLEKYTTIAIFGLDNRSNGDFSYGNSDVIMVASINNNTKEVKLVSIYRDTYLSMTDSERTFNKANAAYNEGGPQQAISMLNINLDLDITDYITVDFNAVATAVDLLDGIDIEVNAVEADAMKGYIDEVAEMTGKDAHFINGAGLYHMDGVQATAYARVRQTKGSDFKRTERQRLVIEKMMEKALDSDLKTINNLIDGVFKEVSTSLQYTEILALAKNAFSYSMGDNGGFPEERTTVKMELPHLSQPQECEIPNDLAKNVKLLHEFLYESEAYEVTESVKNISNEIANKTGLSTVVTE